MKTVSLGLVAVFLSLFPATLIRAQDADFFLPQIADGQSPGLIIRTTFVLFNPTAQSTGFGLTLTDDQGNPLVVTLPGLGTESTFQLSMGPGETRLLETSGEGPLRTGAAVVTGPINAGLSAVFRVSTSDGRFITEAGVGTSSLQTKFVLAVDATSPFNTGVGLFNPGAIESQLTFELFDTEGRTGPTSSASLGAGGHQARYVAGEGELFPALGGFRGTMVVTSTRPITAVVLRQNLSTLTSTTLPVVAANSQIKEFLLPQIANGPYVGGAIRTTFVLFNVSDASADIEVSLTKDDGTPFAVDVGGGPESALSRTLAPRRSVFLTTDGAGTLSSGAARVTSSAPIGVSAIFSLYDPQGGFQTEAGVGASAAVSQLTVPVDTTAGFDSGLALFNPGAFPLAITVRLLGPSGTRLDSTSLQLPVLGHRALMLGEIFPGRHLRGSLSVTSDGPVSAMTLRLNASPLSYTTLPRTAAAFVGLSPRQALQRNTQTGVSVDAPLGLSTDLSTGFFLSGRITGPVSQVTQLVARSLEGPSYPGVFDSVRGEYVVAVPEGSYTLVVCYKPSISASSGIPTLVFAPPDRIVVNADTVVDLSIPPVELRRLAGRLTDLGAMPVTAFLIFTRSDLLAQSQGFVSMEGDYSILVPQGDYSVSLSVNAIGSSGTNHLALYNFAPVQVGAGDTSADFAVPALFTLQGRVTIQGASSVPSGSLVVARDVSAPAFFVADCVVPPAVSTLPADLNGNYSGPLTADRSYDLQASVVVSGAGTLVFPSEPMRRNLTGHLGGVNFSVPSLPSPIEVTGVVRGPGGLPVEDVLVEARGEGLTGVAGAVFTAEARTNALGEFRMLVLPGSNYTFTWTPEL